jgi:tubulin beta
MLFDEASGGKYVPRAESFDFEPGVIDAFHASPLGEFFRPGNLVNHALGQKWTKGHYSRVDINS